MVDPTCCQLKLWAQNGIKVKHIRLDNAGENKLLANTANNADWQLGSLASLSNSLELPPCNSTIWQN